MALGHAKLDVYHLSIGYVAWVYEKADSLNGVHRTTASISIRIAISIPKKENPNKTRISSESSEAKAR